MSTLIFAHDHRFLRVGGAFFDRGGLPEAALNRYANAFGTLAVICRAEEVSHTHLSPISNPRISFYPQKNLRHPRGLWGFPKVNAAITRHVQRADAVVSRLPSLLGWMAARAARLQGTPYLLEVVGNALEAGRLHGSWIGSLSGPIQHWLTRLEVGLSKQVVYITHEYLQALYPTTGETYVCPNVIVEPIDEQALSPRTSSVRKKRRLGLIGSLDVDYKGHTTALKVLRTLSEKHGLADVTLEFAGAGDATRWRRLARKEGVSERVVFHGTIPSGEGIKNWLDKVDVLLQPSLTEGQGRAIVEGMSRGCPVVATDVGGIPELIEHQWLAPRNDVPRLSSLCAKLLTSSDAYRSVSSRNWKISQQYTRDKVEAVRNRALRRLAERVEAAENP